jgi:hypothetical protein
MITANTSGGWRRILTQHPPADGSTAQAITIRGGLRHQLTGERTGPSPDESGTH